MLLVFYIILFINLVSVRKGTGCFGNIDVSTTPVRHVHNREEHTDRDVQMYPYPSVLSTNRTGTQSLPISTPMNVSSISLKHVQSVSANTNTTLSSDVKPILIHSVKTPEAKSNNVTIPSTMEPIVANPVKPTVSNSGAPIRKPVVVPTMNPTMKPTVKPTMKPTMKPTPKKPYFSPPLLPCSIIIEAEPHRSYPKKSFVVADKGIIFYVYGCRGGAGLPPYMREAAETTKYIKQLSPSVASSLSPHSQTKVAVITNLNVPPDFFSIVDVVYRIHPRDLGGRCGKQWATRMLYNAYPPFNVSFAIDSHVAPCNAAAPNEILDLFEKSDVDLSMGNRRNYPGFIMGAGALFRANEKMRQFWYASYRAMVRQGNMDDQWAIVHMLKRRERDWNISFRSLSFNWLFAAHGVNNKGAFFGRGRCYRVSIPVTGRVRFANGGVSFCKVMNGEHDEYVDKLRAYFLSGYCRTKGHDFHLVYSEEELKRMTSPIPYPNLQWSTFQNFSKDGLFWPRR